MGKIGMLNTGKPIETAIREIREWLEKLGINGLEIDTRYDPRANISLVKFRYNNKDYEFRSTKQRNCRLNMWAITRVMESKVRNHLMDIELFEKSMRAYLALEGPLPVDHVSTSFVGFKCYATLGMSHLASNEEIEKRYKHLAKSYHPDMAGSEEAKEIFQKKFMEINEAWQEIKRERGIQ